MRAPPLYASLYNNCRFVNGREWGATEREVGMDGGSRDYFIRAVVDTRLFPRASSLNRIIDPYLRIYIYLVDRSSKLFLFIQVNRNELPIRETLT